MAKLEIKPKENCLPRTFTQEKMQTILNDIKRGSTRKHAAEANGISERHFYYAIKQGTCDIENEQFNTVYAKLVQSLRDIEQNEIIGCREKIMMTDKSHRGAEWTLERVYWQWFGMNAANIDMDERLRRLEQGDKRNERNEEKAKETTDA